MYAHIYGCVVILTDHHMHVLESHEILVRFLRILSFEISCHTEKVNILFFQEKTLFLSFFKAKALGQGTHKCQYF